MNIFNLVSWALLGFTLFMGSPLAYAQEPIGKFLNGNLPTITPIADNSNAQYRAVNAFPNLTFTDPLVILSHPNQNTLVVSSWDGMIHSFDNNPNTSQKQVFADLRDRVFKARGGGLLGMAFHPNFGSSNSYVYIYYAAKGNNGENQPLSFAPYTCVDNARFYNTYMRLSRFEVNPDFTLNKNSELRMINFRLYNNSHRGGGLVFGDDGFLYLTIGDQSRSLTSQDITNNFEGGLIRIDVNQDGSKSHPPRRKLGVNTGESDEYSGVGYYIPNDNPFQSTSGGLFEEFYAVGLRAPHRMTKDRQTGSMWLGDVGNVSREEIDQVVKGANYGWPLYEGNQQGVNTDCGANNISLNIGNYTPPILDFTRGQAKSITGGYVYRGNAFPELNGMYICADYNNNSMYAVSLPQGGATASFRSIGNFAPGNLATFGEDLNGELLMGKVLNDDKKNHNVPLYKLERIPSGGSSSNAPQKLSQTGAFANLANLEPAQGVIPYDMIESFWSDGAEKKRWIAIPNDGSHNSAAEQIQFSENEAWQLPAGSVVIKHFEFGGRKLETRFEVHGDDGVYYYLTYKWDNSGTDATLLEGALDETYNIGGQNIKWHYPSRQECLSCHLPSVGGVIGLKTRYLNKTVTYPKTGMTANQLVALSQMDILNQNISTQNANNYLKIAAVNDGSASLEHRARSYLDLNCSYCHNPQGSSGQAGFNALLTVPLGNQGLVDGNIFDDLGISGARMIVPGDHNKSILYHRMAQVGTAKAMPPLAKNEVDNVGVELIKNWINSMGTPPPPPGPSDYTIVDLAPDGAWSMFTSDKALFHNGHYYIGHSMSNGQVGIYRYNPQTGASTDVIVSTNTSQQVDYRNAPSVTRLADGRLLLVYAKYFVAKTPGGGPFYYRISNTANPATLADWGPEQVREFDGNATYSATMMLSDEGNKLYHFHRGIGHDPSVSISNDQGQSWEYPVKFMNTQGFWKITSDNEKRIDILYNKRYPTHSSNEKTSVFHAYYEGGSFKRTDGSFLKNFSDLPFSSENGTSNDGSWVYQVKNGAWGAGQGPDDYIPGGDTWIQDIAYQSNGNPVATFQVQKDFGGGNSFQNDRLYYYYAVWNGSSWEKRFIAHGGGSIYWQRHGEHSGGIVLDPDNPNVVYLSSCAQNPFDLSPSSVLSAGAVPLNNNRIFEIWKGVTNDGGKTFTWSAITSNSSESNYRPYVPPNHGYDTHVIWYSGRFDFNDDFNTRIKGVFDGKGEPPIVTPPSEQLIANGLYNIQSNANNQHIASGPDNNVFMVDANGDSNEQKWEIAHLGDNVYALKNLETQRFMVVPGAPCGNGENVGTAKKAKSNHQKWGISKQGNAYFLKPLHCTSHALDKNGGNSQNVHLWSFSPGNANQQFSIIPTNPSNGGPTSTPPTGNGNGLQATYFNNMDFSGSSISRVDPVIDFSWGGGSPDPQIGNDTYSARWEGLIEAPASGSYTFYTTSDDGVKLWVNGQLIIDKWVNQGPTEWTGTISMTAGQKVPIKLEYYENGGGAMAKLSWSGPGVGKQIVPQSNLYAEITNNPPPPTPPSGNGKGLQATYFNNMDFSGSSLSRIDPVIDFSWGGGSPDPQIGNDTYSARWEGLIEAPTSGSFTFYTTSDDGVKLWVNGQLIIDKWINQGPTEWTGTISMTAGQKVPIKLEYYENGGGAMAKLSWSGPGVGKQIVPQSNLYAETSSNSPTPNPPPGGGNGLQAIYYDNMNFSGSSISRTDPVIDFNWGLGSPHPQIGNETYSVRWEGSIEAPSSGSYTFYTTTDDGVKLWINGQLIIDKWIDQAPKEWTGTINMNAGQRVTFKMEYYENGGGATAQLSWSGPGVGKQIVPSSQLHSATGGSLASASNSSNPLATQQKSSPSINIYPNPAQDHLYMDLGDFMNAPLEYTLYNIQGQIVHSDRLPKDHPRETALDISRLPNGVFIIIIQGKSELDISKKFVIWRDE